MFAHHRIHMESDVVSMWIVDKLWKRSVMLLVVVPLFVHLVHLWEQIFNKGRIFSSVDAGDIYFGET